MSHFTSVAIDLNMFYKPVQFIEPAPVQGRLLIR